MSNSLAVATVTAALCTYLAEALELDRYKDAYGGATSVKPRRPEAVSSSEKDKLGVGVFLYLVTPNTAWRNSDIVKSFPVPEPPGYTPPKGLDKKPQRTEMTPQVPLNLSYLFSFYGDERILQPQLLLGKIVSAIHSHPRLTPKDIRNCVEKSAYKNYVKGSDLDQQVENIEYITLTPINLGLEEMSKIWSVFFQVPYVLSIAYMASTVLIEADKPKAPQSVAKVKFHSRKPERRHPWMLYHRNVKGPLIDNHKLRNDQKKEERQKERENQEWQAEEQKLKEEDKRKEQVKKKQIRESHLWRKRRDDRA